MTSNDRSRGDSRSRSSVVAKNQIVFLMNLTMALLQFDREPFENKINKNIFIIFFFIEKII